MFGDWKMPLSQLAFRQLASWKTQFYLNCLLLSVSTGNILSIFPPVCIVQ